MANLKQLILKTAGDEEIEAMVKRNLVKSPDGTIYLDTGLTLFSFDGMPLERTAGVDDFEVVGSAPCLYDWQRDPILYGPHYAVVTIIKGDGSHFIAGGSILCIRAWCDVYSASIAPVNAKIVADRNTAHAMSEAQGGVAW